MKKRILFSAIIFVSLAFLPFFVQGADLYVEFSEGNYCPSEEFELTVKIDPEENLINATKIDLAFDNNLLEVVGFDRSNSIFPLWIGEPDLEEVNKNGVISFSGGMPGGFSRQFFGTIWEANSLATIKFKIKDPFLMNSESVLIRFLPTSLAFISDGWGGLADLSFESPTKILSGFLYYWGF